VSSLNYVSPMVQPSGNSIPMFFGRVVIAVQQIHNTRRGDSRSGVHPM